MKSILRKTLKPTMNDVDTRFYSLAKDFEFIHTVLNPRKRQEPAHGHSFATEVTYVISGYVRVHEDGNAEPTDFVEGDVFAFAPDGKLHSLENPGDSPCLLLTAKFLSDKTDHTLDFFADVVGSKPRRKLDDALREDMRIRKTFGRSEPG